MTTPTQPYEQPKWKSCAQWPKGTCDSINNYSEDTHFSESAAEAVVSLLYENGFGGDRKIFPVRAWSEEITPSTQGQPDEQGKPLTCPFCGGKPALVREGTRRFSCIVHCEDCGCRLESNEIGIYQAWNRREGILPASGEAQAWSKSLPNESGLWWWWNEDEDSMPLPVTIMYSGTSDSYFASEGQWGWTRFQNVEEMGGWWMKCIEPERPTL